MSHLRPLRKKRLASKADCRASANFASTKSNANLKAELPNEKKGLLSSLNVRNVAANIWLTRYVSWPMNIITSVARGNIFFASMTATFLSINEKLQKNILCLSWTQKRTLPVSLKS